MVQNRDLNKTKSKNTEIISYGGMHWQMQFVFPSVLLGWVWQAQSRGQRSSTIIPTLDLSLE